MAVSRAVHAPAALTGVSGTAGTTSDSDSANGYWFAFPVCVYKDTVKYVDRTCKLIRFRLKYHFVECGMADSTYQHTQIKYPIMLSLSRQSLDTPYSEFPISTAIPDVACLSFATQVNLLTGEYNQ
jgi:hypothetical protein